MAATLRNGTVDLYAALNVGTGEIVHQTRQRHTAKDVLALFRWLDAHAPAELEVHVVLDNLSTHTAPPVAEWLAHPKRQRWHLHLTPTSASWLNLIESWFAQLTNRRLRRGVLTSVDDLVDAIDLWAEAWNENPTPFVSRKPAEDVIADVRRGRADARSGHIGRRRCRRDVGGAARPVARPSPPGGRAAGRRQGCPTEAIRRSRNRWRRGTRR